MRIVMKNRKKMNQKGILQSDHKEMKMKRNNSLSVLKNKIILQKERITKKE